MKKIKIAISVVVMYLVPDVVFPFLLGFFLKLTYGLLGVVTDFVYGVEAFILANILGRLSIIVAAFLSVSDDDKLTKTGFRLSAASLVFSAVSYFVLLIRTNGFMWATIPFVLAFLFWAFQLGKAAIDKK